ncbi:MAG: hypothetical protein P1P88_10385 [Bacteroidales bacterium]|nr:hypothetical protein [Bacteroidales bacterium]
MDFKTKFSILFVLSGIIPFGQIQAQEIKVEAKLDSFAIELGDQVWLDLRIDQAKNAIVLFPDIKDTIIKGIEVIEKSHIDTQVIGERLLTSQKILITAFEDSIFKIPPFAFRFGKDTIYSNSLILSVKDVDVDSTLRAKIDTSQVLQIFDVKDPINTPFTFKEFFQRYYKIILIVLGVLLIIGILIIYFVRKAANKPFIKLPEKPKEPAHIIALKALDELKAKKLWQADKVKAYYSELTEIIRQYLEDRFQIPTFERTSYELLESIKTDNILDSDLFEKLKQTLSLADLAKFAKYKPLPDENDVCLKNSYHLVEKTKLIEKVQSSDTQHLDDNQVITGNLEIENQTNKKF